MDFPFSALFMRCALAAILLIAPLYALLGTAAVSRGMAFFSESLGHGALCGVAIGSLLGVADSPLALVAFGIVYAALLTLLQSRGTLATDASIGVLSSLTVALGVALLSRGGGFAKYSALLVGDLLSVAPEDLWVLSGALLVTLIYWCLCYNALLLSGAGAQLAASRGVRVRALQMSFTMLVAVVVMLSIRYVGTLLINAMLILPAAAARNVARNMRAYQLLAVGLAAGCGVLGLIASYYLGIAAGAAIVLCLGAAFCGTFAIGALSGRRPGGGGATPP